MLGSRNSSGATSTPDTAPTVAASPQPSASVQPTRMPTSRAEAGLAATARIPRPILVCWKSRYSRPMTTADHGR